MSWYLGIDTSNYTTSVALYNPKENIVKSHKKLLCVNDGEIGLRQSEALFQHIKQIDTIVLEVMNDFSGEISAIGVSSKPSNAENSYMPCFLAGVAVAKSIGAVLGVPVFEFSHQSGHIAAALYSSGKLDLIGTEFFAFHISGGTTDALLVSENKDNTFNCKLIAHSLDLKMGQVIDRVGVMLNLPFPAGKYLDELARNGVSPIKVKPTMKGENCCLSGVENQCRNLFEKGESKENIARYVIEYCEAVIENMINTLSDKYGKKPLLFSGGVMSNSIIRENIKNKYGAFFAQPQFSSDNACGAAVLGFYKNKLNLE